MTNFAIAYADVQGFPAGSSVSSVVLSVTAPADANGVSNVTTIPLAPGATSASFDAVAVGTHSVSVQAFDATGSALGNAVTTSFDVAAPVTVTLSLPSSVSVA